MGYSKRLVHLLIVVWTPLALAVTATSTDAVDERRFDLAIERQAAGAALIELGERAGIQIAVPSTVSQQKELGPVTGRYTVVEALDSMLKDSGLAYHFAANDSVVIGLDEEAADDGSADGAAETGTATGTVADESEQPPEEIIVTGSRIVAGDPTARVFTFTTEDIRARGVTSIEELFRTLPFAYAGTTTQNNDNPVGAGDTEEFRTGGINVGISTVNLRALGSANTLVLLNGRRTAGVAGVEDNYANLVNVPLSAIERIDIQLDGSSAVYGADVIGGVVNFITKKNYSGATFQVRDEYSSTDADARKVSFQGGYGWGSGQITAVLSRDSSQPITNEKTGWTSYDYRDRYGVEFDSRDDRVGQPGVVCPSTFPGFYGPYCGPARFPLDAGLVEDRLHRQDRKCRWTVQGLSRSDLWAA